LYEHWDTLTRASQNGAGVFVTVNETDGKGRKTANIIRVRAVFVDTDGADIEPIRAAQPHILVESSPGNYHAYWLVTDAPLDAFKGAQKAMSKAWSTDKGVNDLPRVMRLPGFPHQKMSAQKGLTGSPFMVQMVNDVPSDGDRTWAERKAFIDTLKPSNGLPLPHRASVKNHVRSNEITIGDMAGALQVEYAEIEKALAVFPAADAAYDEPMLLMTSGLRSVWLCAMSSKALTSACSYGIVGHNLTRATVGLTISANVGRAFRRVQITL
jgi:hypothetical protein